MRPFRALLSYQEAKEVIDGGTVPVMRLATVPLDEAPGRVLAEDFVAAMSIPPFNRAAMDGYAVKAKETFGAGQFHPRVLMLVVEFHSG